MAVIYKLPAPFLTRFKDKLDAWDWKADPEMPLDLLDEELAGYSLECVSEGAKLKVRSKGPHAMLKVRKYVDTLEGS